MVPAPLLIRVCSLLWVITNIRHADAKIKSKPTIAYWKIGNRLEAVDRKHPSLICVATVIDVNPNENQVTLHFDGWSALYDYTANVQSTDLHPIGFCEKNQYELQKPKDYSGFFNWTRYLNEIQAEPVPEEAFSKHQTRKIIPSLRSLRPSSRSNRPTSRGPSVVGWEVRQKLEAVDRRNPSQIFVATVKTVDHKNNNVLIHFDEWYDYYDYWANVDSTDLHPIGYSDHQGLPLETPKEYYESTDVGFIWPKYLLSKSSRGVPYSLFNKAQLGGTPDILNNLDGPPTEGWEVGQRLEAKDRKNPSMICVATVAAISTVYNKVRITFDGWGNGYDYTTDVDNLDLHPVGYCEHVGHSLEIPYGYTDDFDWSTYLDEVAGTAVPHKLFLESQTEGSSEFIPTTPIVGPSVDGWKAGQRLEVFDRKYTDQLYVATVSSVDDVKNKVLIHWDGWTDDWNFRTNVDNEDLHPVGYSAHVGQTLNKPLGYFNDFDWSVYLDEEKATVVPFELFKENQKNGTPEYVPTAPVLGPSVAGWKAGQRLEVMDRKYTEDIYVATIASVDDVKNKVLIHWDGWGDNYDIKTNVDNADLHPVGYCDHVNQSLVAPLGYIGEFDWSTYLDEEEATTVPHKLFTEDQTAGSPKFIQTAPVLGPSVAEWKIGQKLEVMDQKYTDDIYVATISSIDDIKNKVTVNFDGWSAAYDIITNVDSDDLHPVGYCQHVGKELRAPAGYIDEFNWSNYLYEEDANPVPHKLFTEIQTEGTLEFVPKTPVLGPSVEGWKVGQKLEVMDRQYTNQIYVATVATVDNVKNKVLIHWDGWGDDWDSETNVDNVDLHPIGFSAHVGHNLISPLGYEEYFDWYTYLKTQNATAVPHKLFTEAQKEGTPEYILTPPALGPSVEGWKIGQRLEVADRKSNNDIYVATIASVDDVENKVKIHWDGWGDNYDITVNVDNKHLHPIGYCDHLGIQLLKPYGYINDFDWSSYLEEEEASAVPHALFTKAQTEDTTEFKPTALVLGPTVEGWKVGQKLEAIDRLNPSLIGVASIKEVDSVKNKVTISFDGWSDKYNYRTNVDSPDLHPIGYCDSKELKLQLPKSYQGAFEWSEYLEKENAEAVPENLFNSAQTGVPA